MKRILIFNLIIISLCGILCGCGAKAGDKSAQNRLNMLPAVEGIVVKPSILTQTITISGTLRPDEETVLMPDVSGRVVRINLQEGRFAKQGALLIKLFDDDLQAQLIKAQAQLGIAEQTEKRQAELLKISGVSQSDYDQAALQLTSVKADIAVLKAQIRKTEILAPFDGIVGLKNISVGAEVTPGTPLATIRASHRLKLDFSVPEKYSLGVHKGMQAKFSLQGDPKTYTTTVMATEEGIDPGTRTLKVRAVADSVSLPLISGAFVTVELLLGEDKNALMVPTQALIPQDRDIRIIVAKQGAAKFVTVKTGVRQEANIQILKGIAAGDTVVTTGLLFIKPGAPLTFSRVK